MEIAQIINSIFTSNTFVIDAGGSGLCLVDCGDIDPVVELARKSGRPIEKVLLTHAHFDHIYGLPRLIELYPQVEIYTNDNGIAELANDRINFSRYHDAPITVESDRVRAIADGDVLTLGPGVEAEVMSTPGHDYSCLTYRIGDKLFTGDAYIPGVKVICTFPKSNKAQAKENYERLQALAVDYDIYPGHGEIAYH